MQFISYSFLAFFPVLVFLYFLFPAKARWLVLLAGSWFFYACMDIRLLFPLLYMTIATYAGGWWINARKSRGKSTHFPAALISALCILGLVLFKYPAFFTRLLHSEESGSPASAAGISFYTLQALSYPLDIERGRIKPCRNFLRYALYVAFFPCILSGPVERADHLLEELKKPASFEFDRFRSGLLLMVWGYFLKLVIADRAAIFTNAVFSQPETMTGWWQTAALALYAVQIYADFAGYSCIAVGAAEVLGFAVHPNFKAPFFSRSTAELWRRWHMTLGEWLRDYIYIPLGGSHKGRFRKYINILIVFLISGLWHGLTVPFLFWGMLNGLYQILGDALKPFRAWIRKELGIHEETAGHHILQSVVVFLLFAFSLAFFRSSTMAEAFSMLKSMLSADNPWIFFDGELYENGLLNRQNAAVLWISLLILFLVDFCTCRGIVIRKRILQQDWWLRWLIGIGAVLAVLVLGIWGSVYSEAGFIYFHF